MNDETGLGKLCRALGKLEEFVAEPVRNDRDRVRDEEAWLGMLKDRNLTSHIYNEDLARDISDRVVSVYLGLIQRLVEDLRAREQA